MNKSEKATLRIKNFRSLKDVEIELRPNVYLFGSNGSGKSSMLKAIAFFGNYLTNVLNYDLGTTNPYYFMVKSALKINEYSIFNSYKDIVINNDTSKNIEFITNISNHKIRKRKLTDIPKSHFIDEYTFIIDNYDASDQPLDYLYNLAADPQKQSLESSFLENEENEIQEYQYSNFKANFIFNQENDEYNLLKTIRFEDIEQGFVFSFIPRLVSSDDNLYPHLVSIFQCPVENDEIEFIRNFLLNHLSIMPEFSRTISYSHSSTPIEESTVRELHSYFKGMEKASTANILGKLSVDEKRLLFEKILAITDKLFIHFPKKIASLYSNLFYIPSIRELPKHSYQLSGGRFSDTDYMGILKRLDEDVFVPKLLDEINDSINNDFGLDESIDIYKEELSGCIRTRQSKNESLSNLSNASSGIQQLLPIICYLLNPDHPPSLFLCEQPELHLHPKLQTLLASFLVKEHEGVKIKLFETHSEHMIRKVQTLLAKGELQKDDIIVYYFYKDKETGNTIEKEMEMEDNGFFKEPWPDGFFDDSYNLAKELIYSRKN